MSRLNALASLSSLTDRMNADELRVLAKFAAKIVGGHAKHGAMDLRNDKRNWRRERLEERVDDVCYGFMEEVQAELWAEDRTIVGLKELREVEPEQMPRHWLAETETP